MISYLLNQVEIKFAKFSHPLKTIIIQLWQHAHIVNDNDGPSVSLSLSLSGLLSVARAEIFMLMIFCNILLAESLHYAPRFMHYSHNYS